MSKFYQIGRLVLLAVMSLSLTANAEQPLLPFVALKAFNSENGLQQNSITHINQDPNGFIWIATENSLNRLDGYEIKHVTGTNNQLASVTINRMIFAGNASLWAATSSGLLQLDSSGRVHKITLPDSPDVISETNYLTDIMLAEDGRIWAVSWHGLFKIDTESLEITASPANRYIKEKNLGLLRTVRYGNSLLIGSTKGVYLFDPRTHTLLPVPFTQSDKSDTSSASHYRQLIVANEQIYAAGEKGLFKIKHSDGDWQWIQLFDDTVADMVQIGDIIYFAHQDRLMQTRLGSKEVSYLFSLSEQLPKLASYKISALFADADKNLWIGTQTRGAYLWSPGSKVFNTLGHMLGKPAYLSDNIAWSFIEDDRGNLWVGTNNGINYVDFSAGTVRSYLMKPHGQPSTGRESVYWIAPGDKYFWLATAEGLLRWTPGHPTGTLIRPPFVEDTENFLVFYVYRFEKKLWLATSHGLLSYDKLNNRFFKEPVRFDAGADSPVYFLKPGKDGLWTANNRELVFYEPGSKQSIPIFKIPTVSRDTDVAISDIYEDNKSLWIATSGEGIFQLDTHNLTVQQHYKINNGFPDNTVYNLIEAGNMLLATSHSGLITLNKNNSQYYQFDYFDGLPSNEFNEGAFYKGSNGLVYLGTAAGIVAFEPQQLQLPVLDKKVILSELLDADEETLKGEFLSQNISLNISPSSSIILKLTTLDFLRPRRWQYEIIVQSDSSKQKLHSTSGHILLGNLSPGYYRISASAILPGYGATPYSPMVKVNVPEQKWWQLSVFNLQLLLLFLLIIWFLYRRFKNKQEILSLNKELLEKEQRLELALLDESTGVWDWQGRLNDLEHSQLTLVYSPKDIRQMNFSEYLAKIHPEDRQPVIEFWQSFAESNLATVRQIFRVRSKHQWHWLSSRGRVSAIDNQGLPTRVTGIWQDISDRKSEEDRLRLLAECFEANSVIQFLTDEHLQIIEVNSAFDQLTGFNGQKLKGKLLTDILFTRMPKSFGHELRQILKVHARWSGVSTLARKKELSVPAEIHIKQLGNAKPRIIYLAMVTPRVDQSNASFQDVTSACSDTLTGLPNQAMLLDRVAHLTQECSATDKLILLTISLTQYDFHKQTLGKDTAAKLIVKLSRILNSITGSVDLLARSGEDKFTMAMVTKDPSTSAAMILGRVLDSLQSPIAISDLRIRITCAFGIAIFPSDEEEPEKLLLRSFEAVELAQKVGPNSFSFYHPEHNQKTADKISMRNELLVALERNEFFLVFQPKIQLQNKKALGFEVFIRWRTKDRGIVYPSTFLPIAKDLHLVDAINAWMIEHSLRVIKRWNDENIATSFSINLFPNDAVDLASIKKLINSIKEKRLPASRIHVEINEAALAMDYRKSREAIDLLVENNIRVTLDDFGNGGVPLNRLIELPIFAVKVSREMVRGIGDSDKAESLLKSVGYLAQQHEWIATAKSIENQHQLEYLRSCGYQIGQGFLFSDPLEENSARDYFVKNR